MVKYLLHLKYLYFLILYFTEIFCNISNFINNLLSFCKWDAICSSRPVLPLLSLFHSFCTSLVEDTCVFFLSLIARIYLQFYFPQGLQLTLVLILFLLLMLLQLHMFQISLLELIFLRKMFYLLYCTYTHFFHPVTYVSCNRKPCSFLYIISFGLVQHLLF